MWAHPRACGENGFGAFFPLAASGSSPRMRGKLRREASGGLEGRLIPAHAGKTARFARAVEVPPAHPRACGENSFPALMVSSCWGSSPRMRGKRLSSCFIMWTVGLIPAHAGKTYKATEDGAVNEAHPRACGENQLVFHAGTVIRGSSPRMRGKRLSNDREAIRAGLIPAHAGKTTGPRP